MSQSTITVDGNEAAATIAYKLSDVVAVYPITPATPMGEQADSAAAVHTPNLWGTVPQVIEMQSEAGAAGAIHGALQTGALATTFTASQGLLLMLPNMYKIAGELTPTVFHIAARALATQALSIFGDHSDVMAARSTGWAMLAAPTVQAAHDFALIAHAATFAARIPFIHFFDGFRTSHEINTITPLSDNQIRAMIDERLVRAHRARALSPEHPTIRGTAHNPDTFFQARETVNRFYQACPAVVERTMERFADLTGRRYQLFSYAGAPDARRVIVIMGSGAETAAQTARALESSGEKVGVLTVHLYRPFSVAHFLHALPPTVKAIAVLDRTKEPGSTGEPLYLDVVAALAEGAASGTTAFHHPPTVIGGRYGLASKEFTPAMARAVFDELRRPSPRNHFTVGINDDVMHTSLPYDPRFSTEDPATVRCVFWGLGADGTVGANKDSIKIIGAEPDTYAQGYFVYDSKKSGSVTTSHLRYGPHPINAPYLVEQANFVAVHQWSFLERFAVLDELAPGGTVLLNSPYGPADVWAQLPRAAQEQIVRQDARLWVIDAARVAREVGLGGRINRIMQTCFFALSAGAPRDHAIEQIRASIRKTYGKRGQAVVDRNLAAVDQALSHLAEVSIPLGILGQQQQRPAVAATAPGFVRDVLAPMLALHGDALPVSALPVDGVYPAGTSKWEKRGLASEIPVWDPDLCIQCGKCAFVCPHGVIRMNVVEPAALADAPAGFESRDARFKELPGQRFTLQVAPDDCTACGLCIEACPAHDRQAPEHKAINFQPVAPILEEQRRNWEFFTALPEVDRTALSPRSIKNSQLLTPLFEFSGACAGCGETPYLKLVSQLFGDRAFVANATGCSSIYGGNLPTTPWTCNAAGRGPAWANSLFEDNAEFGLGMRVTLDKQAAYAAELLPRVATQVGPELAATLLAADQTTEAGIAAQRERVALLKARLAELDDPSAAELLSVADALVRKSVWLVGGDGWAYDIGYGGLDHVLASGRNVNILVLDTEVYSNTGGQASKSTSRGAIAKFAAHGKGTAKKDLSLLAMVYHDVYVARVALGANDQQTLTALLEADAFDGPSLVIAYSHCIAHGYDLRQGLSQQKLAVQSGYWPLFRYNPALAAQGKRALQIDSKEPSIELAEYTSHEARFNTPQGTAPEEAAAVAVQAQHDVQQRWEMYQQLLAVYDPSANGAAHN